MPSTPAVLREAGDSPATIAATLADDRGIEDVAELLSGADRVIAAGNGAAYYAALALELAANLTGATPPVRAVPAGLLSTGDFVWGAGDALLAISSSGEQRDVIECLDRGGPARVAAISSSPESPIAAAASACAPVVVERQEAVTHTQAYLGNIAAALAVLARVSRDEELSEALEQAPRAVARSIDVAADWVGGLDLTRAPLAAITFGTGPGWAAAMQAALLLKEIALLPCEGMETREGATSGMYALSPDHLVLSIPVTGDPHVVEAERVCGRTGAQVLRAPGGDVVDQRLVSLTAFASPLWLAVELAQRRSLDVDDPSWTEAYYGTTRVQDS